MAGALEQALKKRGFEVALLPTAPGFPPAVFGARKVPNAKRTVVFYAHYDGQPVTPSQWSSDPFVPVMRSNALSDHSKDVDWRRASPPFDPEWRLFGRAVSDDKASIVAFLAAFDALSATHTAAVREHQGSLGRRRGSRLRSLGKSAARQSKNSRRPIYFSSAMVRSIKRAGR